MYAVERHTDEYMESCTARLHLDIDFPANEVSHMFTNVPLTCLHLVVMSNNIKCLSVKVQVTASSH